MANLVACPFCGERPIILIADSGGADGGWYHVRCWECGLQTGDYEGLEPMIAVWNKTIGDYHKYPQERDFSDYLEGRNLMLLGMLRSLREAARQFMYNPSQDNKELLEAEIDKQLTRGDL